MRICIVASGLERPSKQESSHLRRTLDGTARIAHELSQTLAQTQHDVTAITDCPQGNLLKSSRTYNLMTVGRHFSLTCIPRFVEILRRTRPDIVHFHGGELMSFFARLSKARTGLPTVHTFTFIPSLVRDSSSITRRALYSLAGMSFRMNIPPSQDLDHVIALTEFARERLISEENIPERNLSVVRYGIPVESFEQSLRGQSEADPGIVFISGTTKIRGFHTFVSSIPIIKSGFRSAKVAVAVRDREDLERSHLNGQNGFDIVGPSDLYHSVSSHSIVVMPFWGHVAVDPPLSMLECMAWGKQVISTPIGSIPEIMSNNRGLVVPPRDARALGKGVLELLNDQSTGQLLSRNARAFVRSNYRWDEAIRSILNIYNRILNN